MLPRHGRHFTFTPYFHGADYYFISRFSAVRRRPMSFRRIAAMAANFAPPAAVIDAAGGDIAVSPILISSASPFTYPQQVAA